MLKSVDNAEMSVLKSKISDAVKFSKFRDLETQLESINPVDVLKEKFSIDFGNELIPIFETIKNAYSEKKYILYLEQVQNAWQIANDGIKDIELRLKVILQIKKLNPPCFFKL